MDRVAVWKMVVLVAVHKSKKQMKQTIFIALFWVFLSSCNLTRSSTFYFPDSHILNHRIIVASFEEKGSHTGQAIRNVRGFNESFQIE